MMDNKTVDIFPGLFVVGGVADRPELMQSSGFTPEGRKGPTSRS